MGSAEVQHCRTVIEQEELPLLKQLGFVPVRNHDEVIHIYPPPGKEMSISDADMNSSLRLKGSARISFQPGSLSTGSASSGSLDSPDSCHSNSSESMDSSDATNNADCEQQRTDSRLCYPEDGNNTLCKDNEQIGLERAHSRPDTLARFLSKLKYLYDEADDEEAVLISRPSGGKYVDQKAVIKAQADKVRNQLELKFRAIPLTMQADKFIEGYRPTQSRRVYNPLQTIRDRKFRSKPNYRTHRVNIWQVPISEQLQDLRWRYQNMRIQSRYTKNERKSKKRSHGNDLLNAKAGQKYNRPERFSRSSSGESSTSNCSESSLNIDKKVKSSARRSSHQSSVSNLHSQLSPHSDYRMESSASSKLLDNDSSTELIDRLQQRHEQDMNHPYGLEPEEIDMAHFKNLLPFEDNEPIPINCEEIGSKRRGTFCRNAANIAETWNRLYKTTSHTSAFSQAVSDRSSRSGNVCDQISDVDSVNSRRRSSQPFASQLSQIQSIASDSTHSIKSEKSNQVCPLVTVTNDAGQVESIEQPVPNNSNLNSYNNSNTSHLGLFAHTAPSLSKFNEFVNHANGSQDRYADVHHNSDGDVKRSSGSALTGPVLNSNIASNLSASLDGSNSKILTVFSDSMQAGNTHNKNVPFNSVSTNNNGSAAGSSRVYKKKSVVHEYHKAPWETSISCLNDELHYLKILFSVALRRDDLLKKRDRDCCKKFQLACAPLGKDLETHKASEYAQYLQSVENDIATKMNTIERGVSTSVDSIRISTDMMVGEVNSTLNKHLRSVTSRVEKLMTCRSSNMSTHLCYSFIEYGLLFIMWVVWGGCQIWKLFTMILSCFRFCSCGLVCA